jgi:ribosomal protein S18 acetylase RimI-like enzyme
MAMLERFQVGGVAEILWDVSDSPATSDLSIVADGLEASNQAAADLAAVRPLACFARSASGEVFGGAIARTWGECCEIQRLWVAPPYRRRGIARQMIELVEAESRKRGCSLLYLETFSFQAPQLYRSAGFEVACEFSSFPGKVTKYIMRKEL